MSAPLNLVFLGCGRITAAHGRRLAGFRDEARCFYASRDRAKAMSFERRLAGAGSYGSYDAALADGRIDVAFVATPPSSHLELALRALRSGKHAIVEKPAFLRAADVDLVTRAEAETGRRVLVAENYAYKPLARTLGGLLAAGVAGDLRFVQVNALKRQRTEGWREDLPQGGALFEGGVHWLDLMAHLGPRVRAVRALRPGGSAGPERSLLVILEYAGGAVGTLAHSWETTSLLGGLGLSWIHGTEGSILFESNGLFVLVAGRARRLIFPGVRDLLGYDAMFDDLLGALRTGREPRMTLERARHDLELVEQAYGSLAEPIAGDGRSHRWPAWPSLMKPQHAAWRLS